MTVTGDRLQTTGYSRRPFPITAHRPFGVSTIRLFGCRPNQQPNSPQPQSRPRPIRPSKHHRRHHPQSVRVVRAILIAPRPVALPPQFQYTRFRPRRWPVQGLVTRDRGPGVDRPHRLQALPTSPIELVELGRQVPITNYGRQLCSLFPFSANYTGAARADRDRMSSNSSSP